MKILLVRTSALGDIVHCLPVLRALRRALPHARIGWVVEKAFAPILEGHPDLDAIVPVRLRAWRGRGLWTHRAEIGRARARIRGFDADVALDLMGNHKGGALARLSGARRVVGAAAAARRESGSAVWLGETVAIPSTAVHAVDRALGLLPGLGVQPGRADFGGDLLLPEPPAATRDLLAGRDASRPLVAIQVGAGWANKTYPPEWWGEVARGLIARDVDVWIPEAPGEEDLARRAARASSAKGRGARLVDAGPFAALAAILRASDLLLGGDTGPLHLAHALGTPVLCLVGPTAPERNGPYGALDRVVFHELPCSRCYKRFDEPKACLLALTPRRVLRRALELLAARRGRDGTTEPASGRV